jgi:hypothetical protein
MLLENLGGIIEITSVVTAFLITHYNVFKYRTSLIGDLYFTQMTQGNDGEYSVQRLRSTLDANDSLKTKILKRQFFRYTYTDLVKATYLKFFYRNNKSVSQKHKYFTRAETKLENQLDLLKVL